MTDNSEKTLKDVYITSLGKFLPGNPISNDEMEDYLGLVGGEPSRYRKRILEANGIKTRHYAIDEDGERTHLAEELMASAVEDALANGGHSVEDLEMLSVGTTIPDLIMPGFASMVHGRLKGNAIDILSASGVCVASMEAMKGAWQSLQVGEHKLAVAGACEAVSPWMRGSRFEQESESSAERKSSEESYGYFNADFLRWMLSDGAGAAVMETKPRKDGISLKVDWISVRSYAHEYTTCMYMGTSTPKAPATETGWTSYPSVTDADADGLFLIRQDTSLLAEGMVSTAVREGRRLVEKGWLKSEEVDHFLPHLSSYFFYDKIEGALEEAGCPIPEDKWFTNLATRGNTGSASIYLILEEAFNEGRFKPGDKILVFVPESGRFAMSYAQFTCVGPDAG
jgi:3-oxoacyl-[acyl-carrier-protein] synthase-3